MRYKDSSLSIQSVRNLAVKHDQIKLLSMWSFHFSKLKKGEKRIISFQILIQTMKENRTNRVRESKIVLKKNFQVICTFVHFTQTFHSM